MIPEKQKRILKYNVNEYVLPFLSESQKLSKLKPIIVTLYNEVNLPFHDIFHITYVGEKTRYFGKFLNKTLPRGEKLNLDRMEAIGLVHDLNYLVNPHSAVEAGSILRHQILTQAGYNDNDIAEIEQIVIEADFQKRTINTYPSLPAQILSDADSAFKVDPKAHAHVALKGGFAKEQNITRKELAKKIVNEQGPFIRAGIFFYTARARKIYQSFAEEDLKRNERILNEEIFEV